MKKKALILLGHQQAMVNFCSLFREMGIDTFAPPFVSAQEKNSISIYRDNSTIFNEELINRYNFFDQDISEKNADEICEIIDSMNFDFIISYFFISWRLNAKLMNLNCSKYFLVWGDEHPNPLIRYVKDIEFEDRFSSCRNAKYIFCHKHLIEIAPKTLPPDKFIQLNIPTKNMNELENSWDHNLKLDNRVLIVCSRVFSSDENTSFALTSCRVFLSSLFLSNPNIEFVLIGKDNANIAKDQLPRNLFIHECSNTDEVFLFMQKCKLMLNFHPILLGEISGNIIQYSQIEASCIGIPMLHCSKSRITDHIGFNSQFTFQIEDQPHLSFDHQSLSRKLQHLLAKSRTELKDISSYQSKLYNSYKISEIKNQYIGSFLQY